MSFLDDIVDVGSNLWSAVTGPGVGAGIARAASLGYMLREVTNSINKENQTPATAASNNPDPGVRLQVNPDTNHSIPIVYGTAYLGGIVTDAFLTSDNQTMWFCITICEKTGNKIDGTASVINFNEMYWDGLKMNFSADGVTVATLSDSEGTSNADIAGLVKVYCFNGGSSSPVGITGYGNPGTAAYNLMPNWTTAHTMDDLVFALVRVQYSRDKNITRLGDIKFKMANTMSQPGDCLNDYMTNTRYGAGIPATEIKSL